MLPPKAYKRKTRPIRIEGDLAYVPLTKGYEAIIDAADVDLVKEFSWNTKFHKTLTYARCAVFVDGKRKHFCMHQVISPTGAGLVTDHINGNGLDNRRVNLRAATTRQNNRNVKGRPWSCKNGVQKRTNGFGAYLYLGKFETRDQAFNAILKAEADLGIK